jgi:hypothetical protein
MSQRSTKSRPRKLEERLVSGNPAAPVLLHRLCKIANFSRGGQATCREEHGADRDETELRGKTLIYYLHPGHELDWWFSGDSGSAVSDYFHTSILTCVRNAWNRLGPTQRCGVLLIEASSGYACAEIPQDVEDGIQDELGRHIAGVIRGEVGADKPFSCGECRFQVSFQAIAPAPQGEEPTASQEVQVTALAPERLANDAPVAETIGQDEKTQHIAREQGEKLIGDRGAVPSPTYDNLIKKFLDASDAIRRDAARQLPRALRERVRQLEGSPSAEKQAFAERANDELLRLGLTIQFPGTDLPSSLVVEPGEADRLRLQAETPEAQQADLPDDLELIPAELGAGRQRRWAERVRPAPLHVSPEQIRGEVAEALGTVMSKLPADSRERLATIDALNQVYRHVIMRPLQEAVRSLLQSDVPADYASKQVYSRKINKVLSDLNFAILDPETSFPASVVPHRSRASSPSSAFRLQDRVTSKQAGTLRPRRHTSSATIRLAPLELVDAIDPQTEQNTTGSPGGSSRA